MKQGAGRTQREASSRGRGDSRKALPVSRSNPARGNSRYPLPTPHYSVAKEEAGSAERGASSQGRGDSRYPLPAPRYRLAKEEAGSAERGASSQGRGDSRYPLLAPRSGPAPHSSPAKSFTDLEVWQKAHAFVLDVYRLTGSFPADERFGLASQFRRAAVSIPANIAEGFRKYGMADKARFFNTAEGSLEECRYYCILAQDLGYGETDNLKDSLEAMAGQLASYIRKLRER